MKLITPSHLVALTLSLFALSSQAQDAWMGGDKVAHVTGSMAIAMVVTAATDSERIGFGTAVVIGAAKEFWDFQHPESHQASFKDLAMDVAGAYVGSKMGGWLFYRDAGEYRFVWSVRF